MQILAGVGAAGGVVASGGQETVTIGGTKYHVFTSSGTLTVTNGGVVSILTVGGGGSGSHYGKAGGGAGELDLFANFTISGNLTITVGAGGTQTTLSAQGNDGGTSSVVEGATTHQSALGLSLIHI